MKLKNFSNILTKLNFGHGTNILGFFNSRQFFLKTWLNKQVAFQFSMVCHHSTQVNPATTNTNFQYSLNKNGFLNEEQQSFYEKNGYLVVKKVLSDQDIEKYLNRFHDIASGRVKPSTFLLLQKELAQAKKQIKEETLYKIQELYADPILFEYCEHSNVLDYVESFIGPNIKAISSMLINKPPDTGSRSSRHPMHQDYIYFPMRPADRIVCAWTALEKINRRNGCLSVVPGSHKGKLLEHDYPKWEGGVNKYYHGVENSSLIENRFHVEIERGDCIFFHPLLIHGSGLNRTKGFRKAISCHYSASECSYFDVGGTMLEKLSKEFMEVFEQKFKPFIDGQNFPITYTDVWKFRAVLVRGAENVETIE